MNMPLCVGPLPQRQHIRAKYILEDFKLGMCTSSGQLRRRLVSKDLPLKRKMSHIHVSAGVEHAVPRS